MAGELLLDTGALVSLLDRSQRHHEACGAFFESWEGAVVSTEAVLTEASHLLGRAHGGREACIEFFVAGGARIVPSSPDTLRRCRDLVRRYQDVPMDFADATLVVLGEDLDTPLVFTTDGDFEVYRFRRRRAFELVPAITRRGSAKPRRPRKRS